MVGTRPRAESTAVPSSPIVQPVSRIVVPVQGTDAEFYAQQWAVELAAAMGLRVVALHVTNPARRVPSDTFQQLRQTSRKWGVALETKILEGAEPVPEIVKELGPRDLVIIGTRRLATHFHMGSVTQELIAKAPCPVQVVRIP